MRSRTLIGISVWSLAILFFFYEFFLRIFLGTIATEVIRDLGLTIRQFSIVGAAYYFTYGIMQIPVGILTEKWGTRLTLTGASASCVLGVFLFLSAESFIPALISRLLIGFGSSFAFVALLILALNWFPQKYFAFLCGLSLLLGAVGPLLAGAPLAYVMSLVEGNWRLILFWIGLFGVGLTLLLALFMRSGPKQTDQKIIFLTPHTPLRTRLKQLLGNRQAWYTSLFQGFVYVPIPLLAAYFGTSYLIARGFDRAEGALLVSMIWIGYAIGNPVLGKLSDRVKRRKPFLYLFALLGGASGLALLYLPTSDPTILGTLFLLMGLACSVQGIAFALIVEHTPKELNSIALGFNNTSSMLFGALFPALAGSMIQATLGGSPAPFLTAANYAKGLSLIPLLYAISGAIALFLVKETFCRQQHAIHTLEVSHKASDLL